jgi:hypothetical protein
MNPKCTLHMTWTALLLLLPLGCSNEHRLMDDGAKAMRVEGRSAKTLDFDRRLIGTWRQTMMDGSTLNREVLVTVTIDDARLIMDGPGCRIEGPYRTSAGSLLFTIHSIRGGGCARTQESGEAEMVPYRIDGSRMTWRPSRPGAGENVFTRIEPAGRE